jgi:hypothetical protein
VCNTIPGCRWRSRSGKHGTAALTHDRPQPGPGAAPGESGVATIRNGKPGRVVPTRRPLPAGRIAYVTRCRYLPVIARDSSLANAGLPQCGRLEPVNAVHRTGKWRDRLTSVNLETEQVEVSDMRRWVFTWLAVAGLAAVAGSAHAQGDGAPWEKFSIAVGGFVTESDTSIQVNSKTLGVGAVVDLETVLGVERSFSTYRIDARYRFGQSRRHEVEFHYFNSDRTGDKVLEEDLQIGDVIFPAGTGVVTDFELQFANIDYVYNFLMDDRVRFGASAGLHTTGVRLKVSETGGPNVEDEEFTAPLPMIGLRAEVLMTERWRLKADVNLFYLEYDNYTGRLGDFILAVEYVPWKHFGIGAGLNSINYRIDADGDSSVADFNGELDFQLTGFMLYGRYFF